MNRQRRSIFEFAAGRRAKWVVFAIWLVGMFISFGANLPGKFTDAEENESTSFLPGDAESTKVLTAAEELQGGELAPAVIVYRRDVRPDARRPPEDRRRRPAPDREALPGGGGRRRHRGVGRPGGRRPGTGRPAARPTGRQPPRGLRRTDHADPGPARRLRALRRADLLGGRQGGHRHRLPEGRRRGRQHPRSDRLLARHGVRPRRGPSGQDHRRRRATRPTPSRSSRASTGRCCWRLSRW